VLLLAGPAPSLHRCVLTPSYKLPVAACRDHSDEDMSPRSAGQCGTAPR